MIHAILEAIRIAELEGLTQSHDESILTGFFEKKLVGALQRLARLWENTPDSCYLEIGVFQSMTLLSVAATNSKLSCYGIDNFAYSDREGKNFGMLLDRREKLHGTNAHAINLDYENGLENLSTHIDGRRVAVFFVDGPHDYRSQLMCRISRFPICMIKA